MNWFSSGRPQAGNESERTEVIRAAMLEALAGTDTHAARILMLRIHCAGDAERLWYMRPEAMSVLASHHGEAMARQTLARLSFHFRELLPQGLASQLHIESIEETS